MSIVLTARDIARYYSVTRGAFAQPGILKALDGASFTLERGKTLAVVGESGCGKSTLARAVTMIELPTAGSLNIAGEEIVGASKQTLRALRPKVQIVFQNPYGSLNPRQKIGHARGAQDTRRHSACEVMHGQDPTTTPSTSQCLG